MTKHLLLALLVVLHAAACSNTAPRAKAPHGQPGTTTIRVESHLQWPYRLVGLAVLVDGQPILERHEPEELVFVPSPLALDPGIHQVVLRVEVDGASGTFGETCLVRLRSRRAFVVASEPALLTLDLHLGDITLNVAERLAIDPRLQGAKFLSAKALRRARQAETALCGGLERGRATICRAQRRLEHAEHWGDRKAAGCYAHKLAQLRRLDDMHKRWAALDPDAPAPAGRAVDMVLVAEQRRETVWKELARCIPFELTSMATREATGAGCGATVVVPQP